MHIILKNCSIYNKNTLLLSDIFLLIETGHRHLFTGQSNSGKSIIGAGLTGKLEVYPKNSALDPAFKDSSSFVQNSKIQSSTATENSESTSLYYNPYAHSASLVSIETAYALLEEERKNDNSDFIEGGLDSGRTPRSYILEKTQIQITEKHELVQLFELEVILDRGLRFLSTGEIRRTLLCTAFLEEKALIILDEPFEGLDTSSRGTLSNFLSSNLAHSKLILISSNEDLPLSFNSIHRFKKSKDDKKSISILSEHIKDVLVSNEALIKTQKVSESGTLVEMRDVEVAWSGKKVLHDFSWQVKKSEHWLIRGPNGSGKTTILELITGDNPQVYKNTIWLFGKKRGTGETIWDIKEKLGIVSWRLHYEYRYLGSLSILEVLISGLYDSIGIYQNYSLSDKKIAQSWLKIVDFPQPENTAFSSLSYGEQRAILILRAAIKNPSLLILDEPCHGLDQEQKEQVLLLLETIAAQGFSTLLHVTHDPSEVLACEKHILELLPGENPMYRVLNV